MNAVFSNLEPCHVQAVADIETATFADAYSMQMIDDCVSSPLYRLSLAATVDGNVVGYILATEVCGDAEILRIAVDDKFRGMKLGSLLLDNFIQKCKNTGVKTIWLEVRQSNTVARALYQRSCFEIVGARRGYYADNGEDAVLYTLDMIGGD